MAVRKAILHTCLRLAESTTSSSSSWTIHLLPADSANPGDVALSVSDASGSSLVLFRLPRALSLHAARCFFCFLCVTVTAVAEGNVFFQGAGQWTHENETPLWLATCAHWATTSSARSAPSLTFTS